MGTIEDRNSKDLAEAEDIKKRWQEYTEELYQKKKIFMTKITIMVWSLTYHLEPDIEASLRIKLVEVMEFQLSSFKS